MKRILSKIKGFFIKPADNREGWTDEDFVKLAEFEYWEAMRDFNDAWRRYEKVVPRHQRTPPWIDWDDRVLKLSALDFDRINVQDKLAEYGKVGK